MEHLKSTLKNKEAIVNQRHVCMAMIQIVEKRVIKKQTQEIAKTKWNKNN